MRACYFSWIPAVCIALLATSCGLFHGADARKAKPVHYEWNDEVTKEGTPVKITRGKFPARPRLVVAG